MSFNLLQNVNIRCAFGLKTLQVVPKSFVIKYIWDKSIHKHFFGRSLKKTNGVLAFLFIASLKAWFFIQFPGAFRLYDLDNDGFITRDELRDIVDSIYKMVVSLCKHLAMSFGKETVQIWKDITHRVNP